jgi:hypothetical protein
MRKLSVPIFIATILLTACGGGGGGGSPATEISTETFQAATIFANQITNGYSQNFSVAGTQVVSGTSYNVTGSGTISESAAIGTTFEGQAALMNVVTINASLTVNGRTVPISSTSHSYSTSNFAPLGETNGEYCVTQGTATIPNTVKVGDTGQIGTMTCYPDSSKSTISGTVEISYEIKPDTATTALANVITKEFDNSHTLLLTDTAKWRLDTLGNISWVSETATGIDPSTHEPYTYVFQ